MTLKEKEIGWERKGRFGKKDYHYRGSDIAKAVKELKGAFPWSFVEMEEIDKVFGDFSVPQKHNQNGSLKGCLLCEEETGSKDKDVCDKCFNKKGCGKKFIFKDKKLGNLDLECGTWVDLKHLNGGANFMKLELCPECQGDDSKGRAYWERRGFREENPKEDVCECGHKISEHFLRGTGCAVLPEKDGFIVSCKCEKLKAKK